jgi:transcriptional regulator with XRE-family HTH domain
MAPSSPTVAGWELALRLGQRREQLGMDVQTITATLGFSRNYWSAVENERKILAEDTLRSVLNAFEFDDEEQRELVALREAAKRRGWWAPYSALLSEGTLRLYGLEHGAQGIRTYESLLIPGLLQTEDYAFDGEFVSIRDSKYRRNPANHPSREPIITVMAAHWTVLLHHLTGRRAEVSAGDVREALGPTSRLASLIL